MNLSDNAFFEEYKRLDKLCSEMYSCQNGISEYISEMDCKAYQGQRIVFEWNHDYKMLKHVRWVRNQIAHNTGSYQISEATDLQFVQDFRERIFSGQDSLTLLRKLTEAEAERRRQLRKQQAGDRTDIPNSTSTSTDTAHKKDSVKWIAGLISAAVLALIILSFCLNH